MIQSSLMGIPTERPSFFGIADLKNHQMQGTK